MLHKYFSKISLAEIAIYATIFSFMLSRVSTLFALLLFTFYYAANYVSPLVDVFTWLRGNTMLVQFIGWSFVLVLAGFIIAIIFTIYAFIYILRELFTRIKDENYRLEQPVTRKEMDDVIRKYLQPFNKPNGSKSKKRNKT
jgi:hypothetical protein